MFNVICGGVRCPSSTKRALSVYSFRPIRPEATLLSPPEPLLQPLLPSRPKYPTQPQLRQNKDDAIVLYGLMSLRMHEMSCRSHQYTQVLLLEINRLRNSTFAQKIFGSCPTWSIPPLTCKSGQAKYQTCTASRKLRRR